MMWWFYFLNSFVAFIETVELVTCRKMVFLQNSGKNWQKQKNLKKRPDLKSIQQIMQYFS